MDTAGRNLSCSRSQVLELVRYTCIPCHDKGTTVNPTSLTCTGDRISIYKRIFFKSRLILWIGRSCRRRLTSTLNIVRSYDYSLFLVVQKPVREYVEVMDVSKTHPSYVPDWLWTALNCASRSNNFTPMALNYILESSLFCGPSSRIVIVLLWSLKACAVKPN